MASSKKIVVAKREVDGIEMGVLEDGTPFLGARGLAGLCGVAPSVIIEWAQEFRADSTKKRDRAIVKSLGAEAAQQPLFTRVIFEGRALHAFPDHVCVAVLEYYAFEVGKEQAQQAYRTLARRTLRDFIYSSVGYDPANQIPAQWRKLHDRLMLNRLPFGYFGVFREMADVLISAIQHGLTVDEHTIPDISVGQAWGRHWADINGDRIHGPRRKYPHEYPDYFPQSGAAIDAWVYPVTALGVFRSWLQALYLPEKYPQYIARKVQLGALQASAAELLLQAIVLEEEEDPKLKDG